MSKVRTSSSLSLPNISTPPPTAFQQGQARIERIFPICPQVMCFFLRTSEFKISATVFLYNFLHNPGSFRERSRRWTLEFEEQGVLLKVFTLRCTIQIDRAHKFGVDELDAFWNFGVSVLLDYKREWPTNTHAAVDHINDSFACAFDIREMHDSDRCWEDRG